nr:retrovirus-related Pol polyprotein from transposon TNT 1-94 [Tanacetum cinerariifolium]GEW89915.1 retrovirus-related Pol polyprotein from transposon TNT 1-94 [Tanacetum cinerariifolium]
MAAYAFVAVEEEDTHEPLTYQEVVACEDSSNWKTSMKEDMDYIKKNKTWELVDHPAGQKLVSCKWLFKIKEGIEGVQKPRYKARLVARGFTQRVCIDYNEVFSLVVRHTSIWVILALNACRDYKLEQLDVKMAFLHGNLEEVIYMRQPPRYEQGNKVCLLKKSLYGLKQSPRQWYKRFDEYMLSNGFKRSSYDSCVYYRSYAPGEYICLLLYVDDMLIACKSKAEIGSTKSFLKKEFDMKELVEAKKILGIKIARDRSRKILRVSQSGISKVPYANAVRSLMYLMVCMRPDIAYAVSVVSRYLANSGKNNWEAMKWILKYLWGTANVGLVYGTNCGNNVDVTGFVDSDYAKNPDKVREVLEAKTVKVLKVGTEHNAADALTKVVPGLKLPHCLELMNLLGLLTDLQQVVLELGSKVKGARFNQSEGSWCSVKRTTRYNRFILDIKGSLKFVSSRVLRQRRLRRMTGAKFDIKKFDGTIDFELWRIKLRALLIQHGCKAALEVLPADMEAQTKADLNKKAHSAVILCLGNKVLREVTGETIAAGVWSKLETLYMTGREALTLEDVMA